MKKTSVNKTASAKPSTTTGPANHKAVKAITRKSALVAGRDPPPVTQVSRTPAKRKQAGGTGEGPEETEIESVPETKPWDLVPGSTGHQVPDSPSEDEDDEGRSKTEQLVDDGAVEAERDRMRQAAQAAEQANRLKPESRDHSPNER